MRSESTDHAVRLPLVEAITRERNAAQKQARRAAIALLSADGVGTNEDWQVEDLHLVV